MFARNSVDNHNKRMINIGKAEGHEEDRIMRSNINTFYYNDLIDQRVIVFGNEESDPIVGYLVRLENLGHDKGSILPIIYNVLTGESLITFGKVVPFTNTRLKVLVTMSPSERWDMVECFNKMGRYKDFTTAALTVHSVDNGTSSFMMRYADINQITLLTYTEFLSRLFDCGFDRHYNFTDYRKANNIPKVI